MNRSCVYTLGCLLAFLLAACSPTTFTSSPMPANTVAATPTNPGAPPPLPPASVVAPTLAARPLVPEFQHIIIVVFENKEFGTVIASPQMPYFNQLAKSYTLLSQFYAVAHPSLPNYLAMISGDTFGVTFDCTSCLYDAPTLPDQLEASGRSWRAYQEDMPSPCFDGAEAGQYAMKHDPFVYFKPIRLDAARCARGVVPLSQLPIDLASGALPNFVFVTPNECNDAHDCEIDVADKWLQAFLPPLQAALDLEARPYLIVLTWDEGQGKHSCCGLPEEAGGRIATILVSPQVKNGFEDDTPYTTYSLLKTMEESWHLPYLGHAADAENVLMTAPWK